MASVPLISPHDALGTNLFGHVLRGQLKRVVPRENEAINEIWIADRDRFSYEGIYSDDRLLRPRVRRGSEWSKPSGRARSCRWRKGCASARRELGVLASSTGTLEELYLAARLARGLNTHNVDHRLRQRDFRDQAADPVFPGLGMALAEVDALQGLLIIGSNLRREVPLLAHRVRKAATARRAGRVPQSGALPLPVPGEGVPHVAHRRTWSLISPPCSALSRRRRARACPRTLRRWSARRGSPISIAPRRRRCSAGERRAVWLGTLAARHARFADLRALAAALAGLAGATLGRLAEGGNAAGAYLAGAVPHREAGGEEPRAART